MYGQTLGGERDVEVMLTPTQTARFRSRRRSDLVEVRSGTKKGVWHHDGEARLRLHDTDARRARWWLAAEGLEDTRAGVARELTRTRVNIEPYILGPIYLANHFTVLAHSGSDPTPATLRSPPSSLPPSSPTRGHPSPSTSMGMSSRALPQLLEPRINPHPVLFPVSTSPNIFADSELRLVS
ncbi:hypothetical protein D9615_006056 [Tricholomella constricta]|uniref:Uncharacterized protein n=1 Tax=Tricholomella constricta TaxID=117010 RepID=A0A8H5H980_9AGAR|nr:hypothetical protein D9615_006056 [Tricholomella constricta]